MPYPSGVVTKGLGSKDQGLWPGEWSGGGSLMRVGSQGKSTGPGKKHTMKREQLPLYAIALATLIVGLVFAGVPAGTLIVIPLVIACR